MSVFFRERVYIDKYWMTETQTLLADYVNHGSEAAFRELAARYFDLVFSTAVRLVGGDTHLAKDVAQTVFVDLARLANTLSREVTLGGWLHRHTCFVAANTLRGERRRQFRERQAMELNEQSDQSATRLGLIAPLLDEAVNQLGAAERMAVLLRYYEQLDFRSLGVALGTNEEAARKRVTRALDKLHAILKRRGVAFSAATLGTVLAGEAVTAAPVGLAASIAGAALSSAATGTETAFTLLQYMTATKLKTSIAAAILIASVVAPLLVQHQAQARLQIQEEVLRRQTRELAQLAADNQRLSGLLAQGSTVPAVPVEQSRELLRLRSEVGLLKRGARNPIVKKAVAPLSREEQLGSIRRKLEAQVDHLKQWLDANQAERIPELKEANDEDWLNNARDLDRDNDFARAASGVRCSAENSVLNKLGNALRQYSQENGGQFPTDLAQLKPFLKNPIDDAILQRYEILPATSLVSELQSGGDWVITQVGPVNPVEDTRMALGLTDSGRWRVRMADARVTNRWTR